jgi:hypothetical protein
VTHHATERSDDSGPELLEGADGLGPRVNPVPVAPLSGIRSPVLEHRSPEPLPLPDDRPSFLVPPLRAFVGPSQLALLVGVPILVLMTWQAALIGAVIAVAGRELHRRVALVPFSFGEGFLPYRDGMDWPHGVQEEDEVHWHWAAVDGRSGAAD